MVADRHSVLTGHPYFWIFVHFFERPRNGFRRFTRRVVLSGLVYYVKSMSRKTRKNRTGSPRTESPDTTTKKEPSPAAASPASRPFLKLGLSAGALLVLLVLVLYRRGFFSPARFDFAGYNLIVITMDTTRADHLGAYGYEKIRTPNIDRLAADGYLFDRAISQAPLTLPSHTSIFTGVFPVSHGVRDNGSYFVPKEAQTLAETLKEKGYSTAAFVSAFILDSKWGLDQGFDTYHDDFDITKADETGIGEVQRPGGETNEVALRWLGEVDPSRPFFAWIHYYDPHDPYTPPEQFLSQYPDRPYDGEIAYVDSLIGQVLDLLKQRNLSQKTLIVITGDHGEGLGEHHELTHALFVYNTTLHVPLILSLPSGGSRRLEQTVDLVDIMPTVLDLLKVPVPAAVEGRSLLPMMKGQKVGEAPSFSESLYSEKHYGWSPLFSLMTDRYHFIDAPRPELYDIQQDVAETKNLVGEQQALAKTMKDRIQELMQKYEAGRTQVKATEMDMESQEILKSLGYIGSGPSEKMKAEGKNIDPKDKIDLVEMLHLAMNDQHAGRLEEGEAKVDSIISRDPEIVDAHLLRGMIASNRQRYDEAIQSFQKTLELNPDITPAIYNLALAYRKSGQIDKALDGFQEVLRRDPFYVYAMQHLAEIYVEKKQPEKAAEYYRKAIERYQAMMKSSSTTEAQVSIHDTLSGVYFSQGNLDAAEHELVELLKLKPDRPDAHYNLAQIYEQRGRTAEAAQEYREEIRYNPSNFKAYNDLAVLMVDARQYDQAVPVLRDAIRIQPDNFAAYYMLAESLLESGGDLQEALAMAEKSVQLNPQFPRGKTLVSEIKRRSGS